MKVLKIVLCLSTVICILLCCFIPASAYSSSQPAYDQLTYVPKYIFDSTAFIGYSNTAGYTGEKAYVNVPGFNTGLPSYQQNRFETLDSYYAGAPYGVKYYAYTRPGTDSTGVTNVSMVTLSNARWNSIGSELDPLIFGNAYEYNLKTTPGDIYGFGDSDVQRTYNDYIEFIFLIPRFEEYDDEEFDVASYVNLFLNVSYGNYDIDPEYGLIRSTKSVTYDASVMNTYDWLEVYGLNYIDDVPGYDDTPVSQWYGTCRVLFYPGRYLSSARHDINGSDIVTKYGLLYSDFAIDVKMTMNESNIDFSYAGEDNAESLSIVYNRFIDSTGYIPIYSCSSYCHNYDGVQSREFISSVLGTSGADVGVIDPNTDFDFVTWIGNTIFGVLRVEFIPGISIANILYVIVGLGVLFMIIKYFAGG